MIERLFVGMLLVIGVIVWLFGSSWFWLPLVAGALFGVALYRMENKRYSINGYYQEVDAKLEADDKYR